MNKTIDTTKLNYLSFLAVILITIPYAVIYFFFFNKEEVAAFFSTLDKYGNYELLFVYFLGFVLSVVLHEFIHLAFFASFCKRGFKSVQFGIKWKKLMAYAHCSEHLDRNKYLIAVVAPFVVLSIIPLLIALLYGSVLLLFYSYIMCICCTGDFVIIYFLLTISKNTTVKDSQEAVGFSYMLK